MHTCLKFKPKITVENLTSLEIVPVALIQC